MNVEYVVGEVGFGPSFGCDNSRVAELEAEVAKLTRHRKILRSSLKECAALGDDIANRRYEALLATAP